MYGRDALEPETLIAVARRACGALAPRPTGVAPRLRKLEGLRAVIFDVYGTLLISASGEVGTLPAVDRPRALTAALRELGLSSRLDDAEAARDLEARILASHASSRAAGAECPEVEIRELWQSLLEDAAERGILERSLETAELEQLAAEYECRVNPIWPMPGARELLAELRAREDLALGIVSNAQFYTPVFLEGLLGDLSSRRGSTLAELGFEASLSAWSYSMGEAKPSTRLFAPLLEELARRGIAPREALYVGNDQRNDVWTAARVGLRTALFAGDARSLRLREDDPRCAAIEPDLVLSELAQLTQARPRLI